MSTPTSPAAVNYYEIRTEVFHHKIGVFGITDTEMERWQQRQMDSSVLLPALANLRWINWQIAHADPDDRKALEDARNELMNLIGHVLSKRNHQGLPD